MAQNTHVYRFHSILIMILIDVTSCHHTLFVALTMNMQVNIVVLENNPFAANNVFEEKKDIVPNQVHVQIEHGVQKIPLGYNPNCMDIKHTPNVNHMHRMHGDNEGREEDVVQTQYRSLPYPPISSKRKIDEAQYYQRGFQDVPFYRSHALKLEYLNHFLYQGGENFRYAICTYSEKGHIMYKLVKYWFVMY